MMPKCPDCTLSVPTINSLKLHLNLCHVNRGLVYACKEESCSRIINGWGDFRRHLVKTHNSSATILPAQEKNTQHPTNINLNLNMVHDFQHNSENINTDNLFISVENIEEQFLSYALSIVSQFYADPTLARSHVQHLILILRDYTERIVNAMKPILSQLCDDKEVKTNEGHVNKMFLILQAISKPWNSTLSTEFKRFKILNASGNFILAEDYVVGDRLDDILYLGRVVQERISVKAKHVPMRNILEKFFSLPNVFQSVLTYIDELQQESRYGIISNFIQSALWKEKLKHFPNKTVFPLFIYFDDFEVNNPLGSHAGIQKLGAVYFSLPCLPPQYRSSVENIFLTLLFHASDRTNIHNGNYNIFKILVNEINFLQEEGITVEFNGQRKKIHFVIGLFLGDNLGINSALGFSESFRADYFCRFCVMKRTDTYHACSVNANLLRNVNDYNEYVRKGAKLTGVKEDSVWNEIKYFHVLLNFMVDIMHDLLEGVCKYDMANVLFHFVFKVKAFSVNNLNAKIKSFNYRINGFSNKLPLFIDADLRKRKISMSASEMLTLVIIFPMLVCDFFIPSPDDEVWTLFLTLREIIVLVSTKNFQIECIQGLDVVVKKHNSLYIKLFGDLKPKFHLLLHYKIVTEMSGPPSHLSVSRFESKHKELKRSANATCSRVNITHTLSMKEQLRVSNRFMSQKGFENKINYGAGEYIEDVRFCDKYFLFSNTLSSQFRNSCFLLPWIQYNGITYRINACVASDLDAYYMPEFGVIQLILINDDENICLVCKKLNTISYDDEMQYYVVNESSTWKCYFIEDLLSPFLAVKHKRKCGTDVVTTRHAL